MADLGGEFDATKVEPAGERKLFPIGEYRVCIVSSEKKPTKSGSAIFLKFQFLDGPFQNKDFTECLNLWNPSEDAVKIAQRTLSAIARAVNVLQLTDTSQLHNKAMLVKVDVIDEKKDGKETGRKVNKFYYKPAQVAAPAAFAAAGPSEPPRAFAGQQAPWGGPA